ncbi:hypothetical protein RvY_14263-2 [Ramazzottius varieornatus]|uniref:Uncharacterized protein n=1 Tax=Ramazzottius varieornatus TaxID=947166 RepID=A0A1D1VQQ1_RAMVA|nr:hypothetical protein RvY_14263-2 [Ramazzottius varieornatus]
MGDRPLPAYYNADAPYIPPARVHPAVRYLTIFADICNALMFVAGATMFMACVVGLILHIFNIQSPFAATYALCFGYFLAAGILISCGIRPLYGAVRTSIEEKAETILTGHNWYPYCYPVLALAALSASSQLKDDVSWRIMACKTTTITDWIGHFIAVHGIIHLTVQTLLLFVISKLNIQLNGQSHLRPLASYMDCVQVMSVVQLVLGFLITAVSIKGLQIYGNEQSSFQFPYNDIDLALTTLYLGLCLISSWFAAFASVMRRSVYFNAYATASLNLCLYLAGHMGLMAVLSYNAAVFCSVGLQPGTGPLATTLSSAQLAGPKSLMAAVSGDLLARMIFCFGVAYGLILFMSWTLHCVRRQGGPTFRNMCS